MWKMLQMKKPDDYVISTGKQYSIKEFANLVMLELGIKFSWKEMVSTQNVTIIMVIAS